MKTNYLLGSLYLVPVLAAPVFHTSTMLVAGTSARTVFTRPGHRAALVDDEHQVVFDNRPLSSSSSSTKTANVPPTSILDTDRPLTTEDLMALSSKTTAAAAASNPPASHRPAGDRKVTISVGTLVVPGSRTGSVVAQLFDPKSARPYLVPGYYVPSQRADIWVVGMIAVFVLVMVGLESWDLLASVVSRAWRREGAIRLEEHDVDLEDGEDTSDDEDGMAPFSGYTHRPDESLRLPEKVDDDEKAGWI